jgi:hypothetical protein
VGCYRSDEGEVVEKAYSAMAPYPNAAVTIHHRKYSSQDTADILKIIWQVIFVE